MKNFVIFFLFFLSLQVFGQDIDSEVGKFAPYIQALREFSRYIPQEKVYLHFDNTSYYQGDNIWFKCYVVTSGQNQLSPWSKTLYVELLNPGGEIIDKRILKIEDGQCYSDFSLNRIPFHSGFYEVRAYTKYMLNFGEDAIFSRLLPVFDKPQTEGNYEERNMTNYYKWTSWQLPMKREDPETGRAVNVRFFPEGGNPVQGISSRIAFEATDKFGNPIDITGVVMGGNTQITTLHEGKGVFTYTPSAGRRKDVAEVEYSGRKYRFDLPDALPTGVVMEVDNLSHPDSIEVILRKNENTLSEALGVAVLNGGKLQNYYFAYIENEGVSFKMDKTSLPAGVSQIVLFNNRGEILSDRLIFTGMQEAQLNINAKTSKPFYMPYELVDMEFSVADKNSNPVNTTFSLSVRDCANEVEGNNNILTDLLLMSEIKGYVRNPSYYFENDDNIHHTALDVLLMVQGWRRYSWKPMAGIDPFELKYLPEQGIEVPGQIVTLVKQTPRPNVNVFATLYERGKEGEQGSAAVEYFVTDQQGRFSFLSGVSGKWDLLLSIVEKRKQKNSRILIDRVFSPEPKSYQYADLQVNIVEKIVEKVTVEEDASENIENDYETYLTAYQDSLAKLGIDERLHLIPEVTIKGRRRRTQEQEIYRMKSTSLTYYDVASESDDIYDSGKYIGDDIHLLLLDMDTDFSFVYSRPQRSASLAILSINEFEPVTSIPTVSSINTNRGEMLYKDKDILFVIDYQPVDWFDMSDRIAYRHLPTRAIKSIYINNNPSVMAQYIICSNPYTTPLQIALGLGCAVFIETYPEGEETPVQGANGVRKTWLEGYSPVSEFYSPNYTELPPEPDYRRTLYWNPNVTTDENGIAKINFYNNSSCRDFNISAETVTPLGMIGVNKDKM